MRTKRFAVGLAVALCALGALSAQAFAKEKIIFGEFVANVHGQNLESSPAKLGVNKEGGIFIEGLNLGGTTFGPLYREDVLNSKGEVIHKAGQVNTSVPPCKKFKVTGLVNKEHFSELLFQLHMTKCITTLEELGGSGRTEERFSNITLGIKLKSNLSAEVGKSESALEIESAALSVKLGLKKCPILIPAQTIPVKESPEKLYEEVVEYTNEPEEPEGWEHSKKLKELYPSGEKGMLTVELAEKFKHIISYGENTGVCSSRRGEENPKLVEEPSSPYNGMLEYTSGHIFGEIEKLEIKNGNLEFIEP